jgi:hypothetical protein
MSQIIFDETHDEAVSINDDGVSGFLSLANELRKLGYVVKTTEKALESELEKASVLVVAFPKREFNFEESKKNTGFYRKRWRLIPHG